MREVNRRILVLDDEPDILEAYRSILTPKRPKLISSRNMPKSDELPEYELTCASTGEEALEKIAFSIRDGKPFTSGFFDVRLGPGIDGIETIKQAKAMDSNMLFVIVTAYQDRKIDDIRDVLGGDFSGRWDFLDKPFASMVIEQKAHNLVANWNTNQRELEYLSELTKLYEEEQVFRSVLGDAFERIIRQCTRALQAKPSSELGGILRQIIDETKSAEEALEAFRKSTRKAA